MLLLLKLLKYNVHKLLIENMLLLFEVATYCNAGIEEGEYQY